MVSARARNRAATAHHVRVMRRRNAPSGIPFHHWRKKDESQVQRTRAMLPQRANLHGFRWRTRPRTVRTVAQIIKERDAKQLICSQRGTAKRPRRLQGIAEPNSVVIAESTRRLVGNLFELEDLGEQVFKGITGPVRAWAALRPSSVESRFEAMHASGLTELVGREEELELLLRRWSKARTGEGQVVLLSGEAGIGKSRLTAALMDRLAGEPHTRLRYFCSPQHTDSALYPIISQMERAARFTHGDSPKAKLDKLDALLAQNSTSAHDAALLAEMLSLPNDGRYPTLELTSPVRRQK